MTNFRQMNWSNVAFLVLSSTFILHRGSAATPDGSSMRVEFGVFDVQLSPGDGWRLMGLDDFQHFNTEFIAAYNRNGLPAIGSFTSGNCCFGTQGGKKLKVSGTKYGFQFPARSTDATQVMCNPDKGYSSMDNFKFFLVPTLKADEHIFTTDDGCVNDHNPGIYIRFPDAPTISSQAKIEFGMYDFEMVPGGGWELMAEADFTMHKDAFVEQYNQYGIPLIANFDSVNCCFALEGGKKLYIEGSVYGYQFPAHSKSASLRCNPAGGYKDEAYKFFKMSTLTAEHTFTSAPRCGTSHNPAIYMRLQAAEPQLQYSQANGDYEYFEFGIYDAQGTPSEQGWEIASAEDLNTYASSFIQNYNAKRGIRVIDGFHSGNCCFSLKGGLMLKIVGSGIQFPGIKAGGIVCNPGLGYTQDTVYNFYGAPVLSENTQFEQIDDCQYDHNPAIWIRNLSSVPDPTASPTLSPTPLVHCEVSIWEAWSSCSATCGSGTHTRFRNITVSPVGGGDSCPPLNETAPCEDSPCVQDCLVDDWTAWTSCNAECGSGVRKRTRGVSSPPKYDGAECPELISTESCNERPCPRNCHVSEWSPYSLCSASCGGGTKERRRSILIGPDFKGDACPETSDIEDCEMQSCPSDAPTSSPTSNPTAEPTRQIDCQVGPWTSVGNCSVECGGGSLLERRYIKSQPENGGQECPPAQELARITPCNRHHCAVDCVMDEWSPFNNCSAPCGTGMHYRRRGILMTPSHGGKACGAKEELSSCNVQDCPIDCTVGEWGDLWTCDRSCGDGQQCKFRAVTRSPMHGGAACPNTTNCTPCNQGACPVHCETSIWSEFGPCTATCGPGMQARVRNVVQQPSPHGEECGALVDLRECNVADCPVDCEVDEWSPYGTCSVSCGSGVYTRTRQITIQPRRNGTYCPPLTDTKACSVGACPVNCEVEDWGAWGACSKSCGLEPRGSRQRVRLVTVRPDHGGRECPSLAQNETCGNGDCPRDCQISEWSTWGTCDVSCGNGSQQRRRWINAEPLFGGNACPATVETGLCDAGSCPIHCNVSAWEEWSECDAACGGGYQTHIRYVLERADFGGTTCPPTAQTRVCNIQPCPTFAPTPAPTPEPIDCEVSSDWGAWSQCSASCGGGDQRRVRTVLTQPAYGGTPCSPTQETRECASEGCPVDCLLDAWGKGWSACSTTCGIGQRTQTRKTLIAPQNGGVACGPTQRNDFCAAAPCPEPCVLGDWRSWSGCSVTCGEGNRTRHRTVIREPRFNGKSCAHSPQYTACQEDPCPVDCEMDEWSPWAGCTRSCGEVGIKVRYRDHKFGPFFGGAACPTDREEQECNRHSCPYNCALSLWSEWSECSNTCGAGTRSSVRHILSQPSHGGADCPPDSELTNTTACDTGPCPISCAADEWGSWSACDSTCGAAHRQRARSVIPSGVGGEDGQVVCPATKEHKECPYKPCPVDCKRTDWSPWSPCSKSCGAGYRERTFLVLQPGGYGGIECEEVTKEVETCNDFACPVDCHWRDWSAWSQCSASCGSGSEVRTRGFYSPALHGGSPCSPTEESRPCNRAPCPEDCVVSNWTAVTECPKTCGGSLQLFHRTILRTAKFGGNGCPFLDTRLPCNEQPCPIDCVQTAWSDCSQSCSVTCGEGTCTRSRTTTLEPSRGGIACGPTEEQAQCSQGPCPVDCVPDEWGSWSVCSVTCGVGERQRMRGIKQHMSHYGMVCPNTEESESCVASVANCPIDCEQDEWSGWGSCSASCGGGVRVRVRFTRTQAQFGGTECNTSAEIKTCGSNPCPVDCEHGTTWDSVGECSATCGSGQLQQKLLVKTEADHGGEGCRNITRSVSCNEQPCPRDCFLDEWSSWSPCDSKCGGGTRTRNREVLVQPKHGGIGCGVLTSEDTCNEHSCPIDCEVSEWAPVTGVCSQSCRDEDSIGVLEESRTILQNMEYFGEPCPSDLLRVNFCNDFPCPKDCELHDWGSWGACTRTCGGGGTHVRTRSVLKNATDGGSACPAKLHEEEPCAQNTPCPINCVTTEWGAWGDCSRSCGGGHMFRNRSIASPAKYGGECDYDLVESSQDTCFDHPCPVDCNITEWSGWDICSVSCGHGYEHRTRAILSQAEYGGLSCPSVEALTASRPCDAGECPIDCNVTEWSRWPACPTTCGNSTRVRSREIITQNNSAGLPCPALEDWQDCVGDLQYCPVNCIMNDWTPWGPCNASCGFGSSHRYRSVQVQAEYGGAACPPEEDNEESKGCNEFACPTPNPTPIPTVEPTSTPTPAPTVLSRWRIVMQAEDEALLSDGCVFGNEGCDEDPTRINCPYRGAGYIQMVVANASISWKIKAPRDGQYHLRIRYALPTTVMNESSKALYRLEHLSINYLYVSTLYFQPTSGQAQATIGDGEAYLHNYLEQVVLVTLHQGENVFTLTSQSAEGPLIDQLAVEYVQHLDKCVPGTKLLLDWWSHAGTRTGIVQSSENKVNLGAGYTGELEGYIDLGALGPWEIQFHLQNGAENVSSTVSTTDRVRMRFNGNVVPDRTNIAAVAKHPVSIRDASAHLEYRFRWESSVHEAAAHMGLVYGVATCAGCSHTYCKAETNHNGYTCRDEGGWCFRKDDHLGPDYSSSGVRIAVFHHREERYGKKHKCSYNDEWEACLCNCADSVEDIHSPAQNPWHPHPLEITPEQS